MLKPSWWTLFQLGLLLRREDTEDPTMCNGSRLMEMLSDVEFTDYHDKLLKAEIDNIADF